MEKRLFIISNATHYLNVKNYIKHKPDALNYIFLTIRPYQGHKEFVKQIEHDTDLILFGNIFTNQQSQLLNYFTVFKNILKVKKVSLKQNFFDKILFTNFFSWNQHFILNQFKTDQKILISDGVGILVIADFRKKGIVVPLKSPPFNGNKFFMEKVLGITKIKKLHFYSPIKIDVAKNDSYEIFRFKSSSTYKKIKKDLFFVGSPIVELGYFPLDLHLKYLRLIKDYYKGYQITYFSHRRELDENLKNYSFFGNVIRNETPFEEKMETEKELPEVIMSYVSSILINLQPIYPEINFLYFPLDINAIPKESVFKRNYKIITKNFESIKDSNFKMFKLN